MKTGQDFRDVAREKNVTRWNIHGCSICGYQCGYVIQGDDVGYDSGCNCSWGGIRPSSWGAVAEHYNLNAGSSDAKERFEKNPRFGEVIREMNAFWGFENPDFLTTLSGNGE